VTQAAPRTWTVLELLRWTTAHFAERGIESARLDAELLLADALGCDRLRLYVEYDKPVGEAERARFRGLVRARAQERVPVALLTGRREFWSLPLTVSRDVLVPRPETETLVEVALAAFPEPEAELRVLDVGTGSGAVALAIASERPKARVTATDVSPAALDVARANAAALGLAERLRWLEGPLFEPLGSDPAGREAPGPLDPLERFHLVVSNPPYVAEREADTLPPELRHEPALALFAGDDGCRVLRGLAAGVGAVLEPGGLAAFELDPRQAERVAGWLAAAGLERVTLHRDAAQRVRVVSARHPVA
jgi:release factor glutamine methyltransferase